ncbi:60S ribosomal protein L37-like [Sciurus carolinensis]|uniref:60S ribosomal protein L37-like n=1 Tax=Sciurus carolinensis TaxID=30640 RepID=UPI001FB506A6|nr:60S ribosomal protein L37-like [Sciurus carolinensis]
MMKGMSSVGKSHHKTHPLCCLHVSEAFCLQRPTCGECGYLPHQERVNWSPKAKSPNTRTGGMRHLQIMHSGFRHGFCE